ncbi:hypothetical protein ACFFQW_03860 [Umezawaea endophytica]|uniref:Uncharacterized protein n=1 Tax=Umezawaea endophytica TaxID=1654476 RepID=A0A9X2VMJ9_9PSEU|nr:hypothetical protein [Umezawaea endophytica]MCS7479285.1 hypothetical protein [Umezawaea endophytica]
MTPDEPVFRVRVEAATLDDLRSAVDDLEPDLGCRAVARAEGDGFAIDVYLPGSRLATTRSATVTVLADETENGLARQAEVGRDNRFAARGEVPRGLGLKE